MLRHYDRERAIWESSLKPNEKLLILALNSFVDANGECWPGQELLSRMTGLTDRTIRNLCTSLESQKIIQRSRRFDKEGHRTSDKYKINFSNIPTGKSRQSLPEKFSDGHDPYRKITTSLPENHDIPTGKSRQSLPENFSGDLSSKNYLEIYPERKEEEVPITPTVTLSSFLEENSVPELSEPQRLPPVNPASQSATNRSTTNTSGKDQRSAAPCDKFAQQCAIGKAMLSANTNPGLPHRIPNQLIGSGLEDIFLGPQPNQFNPELEQYVITSLNKSPHYRETPATLGDARRHIAKLINSLDWITLQTYWDECGASPTQPTQPAQSPRSIIQQIYAELDRLSLTVQLPIEWYKRTKCDLLSELSEQQRLEYLAWLKRQTEVLHV